MQNSLRWPTNPYRTWPLSTSLMSPYGKVPFSQCFTHTVQLSISLVAACFKAFALPGPSAWNALRPVLLMVGSFLPVRCQAKCLLL